MGRYDGEEYAERAPCRPGEHNWAMNGNCWKCNHARGNLIAAAQQLLAVEGAVPSADEPDEPTGPTP